MDKLLKLKNELLKVRKIIIFFSGWWLGYWLNTVLSIGFLSNPNSLILLIGTIITLVVVLFPSWFLKEVTWKEKIEIIFFGCWVASLISGFTVFVMAVSEYISKSVEPIAIRAWMSVNMLKSLFLSGIFNVLERLVRLTRKR